MERFTNILVVVDEKTENRGAVERAVTLARRNQARLTVVNPVRALPYQAPSRIKPELPPHDQEPVLDIIEDWPPDARLPMAPPPSATAQRPSGDPAGRAEMPVSEAAVVIREHMVEEESRLLEHWVDFVRRSGVPAKGKMLRGMPFLEIIREVLRCEHDLVMITAEDRGILKEKLFGSTAMHLMRKCPCPVWVVRHTQPERYTRILAAVDPVPLEEGQYAINIRIMDLATSMARRDACELVVVHTWTFPAEDSLRSGYLVASNGLDRWVGEAGDLHRRRLAELLRPYALQDLKSQVYMLKGEPGDMIPKLAAKMEVGLIVMGTVSRTGVAGFLIGSTAERILRQVDCAVLAVKPEGFVTPVRLTG
jgi:nucleotide-binding universal stress UspA family protein